MKITIEIPKKLESTLNACAKACDKSVSDMVEGQILAYLEDMQDLATALEGRKERLAGEKYESWDSIKAELGL